MASPTTEVPYRHQQQQQQGLPSITSLTNGLPPTSQQRSPTQLSATDSTRDSGNWPQVQSKRKSSHVLYCFAIGLGGTSRPSSHAAFPEEQRSATSCEANTLIQYLRSLADAALTTAHCIAALPVAPNHLIPLSHMIGPLIPPDHPSSHIL